MHHAHGVAVLQQRRIFLVQLRGRFEAAIGGEIFCKRPVDGSWDVSGDRIERLDLSTKAFGRTCVHQESDF